MSDSGGWEDRAACVGVDQKVFFERSGGGGGNPRWKRICMSCPVRAACLQEALDTERGAQYRFGVFGGLTPEQRAALDDRRPAGYQHAKGA